MPKVDTESVAGRVRHPIDETKLCNYLCEHMRGQFEGPLTVKQFGYGQSNPSYQLIDGKNRKYVLRKQPPGALLSKTAHRVDREFFMLKALGEHTQVPVPRVYVLCLDRDVVGSDFFVMEFLQGRILQSPNIPDVTPGERTAIWNAAIDTLALLHDVDPRAIGLPESFTKKMSSHYPRQLATLSTIADAQSTVKNDKTGEELGPIPYFGEIKEWLQAHLPLEKVTIVHGDYKIDNLVYHPTENRIIGILDWELCTIGHPLADLGNLLQPYSIPYIPGPKGLNTLDQDLPGLPTLAEQLENYKRASRFDPIPDWQFAETYAHLRLAVIIHGIAARVQRGQASSSQAAKLAPLYVAFAELAKRAISRAESKL